MKRFYLFELVVDSLLSTGALGIVITKGYQNYDTIRQFS